MRIALRSLSWCVAPLALLVASACGTEEPAGPPPPPAPPPPPGSIAHTFPSFTVNPGDNIYTCQSWTLDNDEPLWVNTVEMTSQGGFHHANLLFVPEDQYTGPDGTWNCSEREYSEVAAGTAGGVFFAMSTQSETDRQEFPPGAAFRIPPRSRILGGVHLLNITTEPLVTAMTLQAVTLAETAVTTPLQELYITNTALDIPARTVGAFTTDCNVATSYRSRARRAMDFNIYYVLPHFHEIAAGFTLTLSGGTRDGEVVFDTGGGVGDPLGMTMTEPFNVAGATGFRLTCTFDNASDAAVRYGLDREDEMCVMLAYTDAPVKVLGQTSGASTAGAPDVDGTIPYMADCVGLAVSPNND
jgi:hypothetical protein